MNCIDNECVDCSCPKNTGRPKRFTGVSSRKVDRKALTKKNFKIAKQIPDEILENPELKQAISMLPENYNFEIFKSIHQIKQNNAKRVALQFPEGLLMYSLIIADIIEEFCSAETVVMGDVTYGACCIDDLTAIKAGCDFMIHYGHSCLIPVGVTKIKTLYVFVDIGIDIEHFVATVKHNIEPTVKIALVATIQFVASLQKALPFLSEYDIYVPQCRPLSKGEILGCTAPKIPGRDLLLYLGDGRFHLEAIMIANPGIPAIRYDPYSRKITKEKYDHKEMKQLRSEAIEEATNVRRWGVIQGTLGRQGSPKVTEYLEKQLIEKGIKYVKVLLPEILDHKLNQFSKVDAWVQVACPRLSIDWGYAFSKPLLTPYEASVALGKAPKWEKLENEDYPMDFYASDSLGPWTPNHK